MSSAAEDLEPVEPSALAVVARRAAMGDLEATRELVEALAPRVTRVVRAIVGPSYAEVDDVAQQALIALVQAIPRFRGECEPGSYATRIAVRIAVTARRRARTWVSRHDSGIDASELANGSDAPFDVAAANRRKEIVRQLLDTLPDEQADALALRFMLGWSLDEIAASTAAPLNTVRSRLRLAKEALRRRIERDHALADELEVLP